MELKVWVEGIQRIVCGVTEATTCQDVVFALAHATNKIGRFTLIERWRTNERHLAPNENPLKILMKWGEYSNDVQFILQQSEAKPTATSAAAATNTTTTTQQSPSKAAATSIGNNQNNNNSNRQPMIIEGGHDPSSAAATVAKGGGPTMITPPRLLPGKVVDLNNLDSVQLSVDSKKKLEFKENIGVVRGIPQQHQSQQSVGNGGGQKQIHDSSPVMQHAKPAGFVLPTVMSSPSAASHSPQSSIDSNNLQGGQLQKRNFNSMDIRNNLMDRLCTSNAASPTTGNDAVIVQNHSQQSPIISNNGALVPPPYRNPPPPTTATNPTNPSNNNNNNSNINNNSSGNNALNLQRQSQLQQQQQQQQLNEELVELQDIHAGGGISAAQYRDLVQLIKLQRDQMTVQQMDISKLDQEIELLEQRDRDHASQMEALAREIVEQDHLLRQGADQLQSLQYVEEEGELMRQQEKTLGAEIALLRSKLANCETELLQCRNKVQLLVDEIQLEQRAMQFENRAQMEAQILGEMERLQGDIEHIVKKSEGTIGATSSLKHEISFIEGAIADKKKQVEQLVHEMKEVNLQSLSVMAQPSEEIRHLLEGGGGSTRQGSTRRIIGSPRQLENAVPTSKNPHGVWV